MRGGVGGSRDTCDLRLRLGSFRSSAEDRLASTSHPASTCRRDCGFTRSCISHCRFHFLLTVLGLNTDCKRDYTSRAECGLCWGQERRQRAQRHLLSSNPSGVFHTVYIHKPLDFPIPHVKSASCSQRGTEPLFKSIQPTLDREPSRRLRVRHGAPENQVGARRISDHLLCYLRKLGTGVPRRPRSWRGLFHSRGCEAAEIVSSPDVPELVATLHCVNVLTTPRDSEEDLPP